MIKIKFKLNLWLKLNSFLSRHEKECDDLKPASTTQGSILYGIAFYCICDQNYLGGLRKLQKNYNNHLMAIISHAQTVVNSK